MAYSQLNECKDCNQLYGALHVIDEKIKIASKNQLLNETYLTNKKFCKKRLKKMLIYRDILLSLIYNSKYVSPEFNYLQIVSKIKLL